jgi:endonuclease YncB( thermonuclease family)
MVGGFGDAARACAAKTETLLVWAAGTPSARYTLSWLALRRERGTWPMLAAAIVFACCASVSVAAQSITDGDTVKVDGITYRLWGIDAPELHQSCPDGFPAGSMAARQLSAMMRGSPCHHPPTRKGPR